MKTRPAAVFSLVLVTIFGISGIQEASARPQFARKENKQCVYCHLEPTGGARGFRGIYYKLHDHSLKNFDEKRESALAGVRANAMGEDSKPTKSYPAPRSDSQ
jgi:hypothetical protein